MKPFKSPTPYPYISFTIMLLMLSSFPLVSSKLEKIEDFETAFFKLSTRDLGMYEIDIGIPKTDNIWLASFNDINGDNNTDIIAVDKNLNTVLIYTYDASSTKFSLFQEIKILEDGSGSAIQDVYFYDFSSTGNLDLCVMTGDGESGDLKFYFRLQKNAKFSQKPDISLDGIIFSGRPLLFQLFDESIKNLKTYILVQEL